MAAGDAVASDANADAERPGVMCSSQFLTTGAYFLRGGEIDGPDLLDGFGYEGMKITTDMFWMRELGYILHI